MGTIIDLLGGMDKLILLAIGTVFVPLLVKFIVVGTRERYARFLAALADEATDDLMLKYPDNKWADLADEAVDLIIAKLGWEKMTMTATKKMRIKNAVKRDVQKMKRVGTITPKEHDTALTKLKEMDVA